jgi:serralysin
MQTLANYMTTEYWRDVNQAPHSFDSGTIAVSISGLTAPAQVMARAALEAWSSVANLQFNVGSGGKITFDDTSSGASTSSRYSGDSTLSSHINVSTSWLEANGSTVGTWSFKTFIHELGHALGLGHTGTHSGSADYETAALFKNDSFQATVMSYFTQDENSDVNATRAKPVTPMMADILAIQSIYGKAHGGPSQGATTWGIGSDLGTYLDKVFQGAGAGLKDRAMTIWDEGGTDTVSFANDTTAQRINLGAGQFSSTYGEVGNVGIAFGTVIENYVAGSAGDVVNGNGVGNMLKLRGGNDTANGGGGNDVIFGDGGSDRLIGGNGADALWGGDGADRLLGGAGNDRMTGGAGSDVFFFAGGRDVVLDFRNDVDTLALDDALWGRQDLTKGEILDKATLDDGDVLFDFGNGNTLRIENLTQISQLRDDFYIV